MFLSQGVRALLRGLGKGESKVAIVFALDAETCRRAVTHIQNGAPGIPIVLFSRGEPAAEIAALCERVAVNRSSRALIAAAARLSWSRWIAIAVAPWTGVRGKWLFKSAPLLIPPFHALILNEAGDFFPATPGCVRQHIMRRTGDALRRLNCRRRDMMHWVADRCRSGAEYAAAGRLWMELTCYRAIALAERFAGGRSARSFRYQGNGEQLPLTARAPLDRSTVRLAETGSVWHRSAVQRALASEASLLFWHGPGLEQQGHEDLLPLFEDPRTFAVSRQMHVRGWKPVSMSTAPFRGLQDGEFSQVLAPLSQAILVDCRKLLALGVPDVSLSAAAWMIIFRRAAAAGWRSYSVGPCTNQAEQPDMPMDEVCFRIHLWMNRSLRQLGPQDPDLCRGNIASAAGLRRDGSRSGRLKVLLVSPFLPFPLSHGGAVRIFNLCRALSPHVDFILAAFREQNEFVDYERLRDVFHDVYIVDRDQRPGSNERLPAQVREYENSGMRALIGEIAREWKPDILQIEYTHMARFRDAAPDVPAILVEHDLTYQLYRQLAHGPNADPSGWAEYRRWLEFETHWLTAYDGVWTVSHKDAEIAATRGNREAGRTFAVPNGVDTGRFSPQAGASDVSEILYVGSFRHVPNILGFQNLRDKVLPRIWKQRPEVRCRVVAGLNHAEFWSRFSRDGGPADFDPRVQIEGFVKDLRPLYAKATVVVVPLEVSAGTNIKVLEAMACGKAIVSTPRGCNGLDLRDGIEVSIASDWSEFSERVVDVLGSESLRSRLGQSARRTAEARFDWDRIAAAAYESYLELGNTSAGYGSRIRVSK